VENWETDIRSDLCVVSSFYGLSKGLTEAVSVVTDFASHAATSNGEECGVSFFLWPIICGNHQHICSERNARIIFDSTQSPNVEQDEFHKICRVRRR